MIKILNRVLCVLLLVVALSFSVSEAITTKGKMLGEISISGNSRIDNETILYYIRTKEGTIYNDTLIREDIKRIYNIGHFEEVEVSALECEKNICLTFIVVENPSVNSVSIKGNDDVALDTITEKLKITKGDVFNNNLIKATIESIKELYGEKGFYFAKVTSSKKKTTTGQVDVIFEIEEQKKIRVESIEFEGNESFSNWKLKGQMKTNTKGLFSFITDSGIYKREFLTKDISRLEEFYKENGFAKVVIHDPDVEINKKDNRIDIKISIKEGAVYKMKSIAVTGDDTFTEEELLGEVVLKPGDTFNKRQLNLDIFSLNKLYSQKGYAYANIIPLINYEGDEKLISVTLEISRARKFYVGKINIVGNDKTRDRVIRREFRFKEGEVFDSWKLERTRQRLMNLGFFEGVEFEESRGDADDVLDITVRVKERPTGQFSISAGYSSVEKFVFSSQISLGNLYGRGQRVSLTAEKSSVRKQFVLDFYEPWILDRDLSVGFDIFTRDLDNNNNKSISYGGGSRLGRSVGEFTKVNLGYRFKYEDVREVDNPSIFNREGVTKISSLMPSLTRDTRDDFLNPTKGARTILGAEYAGGLILGGVDFYKFDAELSRYFPLKWKFVGLIHLKGGFSEAIGEDVVPITERYFLDGLSGMRGYKTKDVGPRDEHKNGPLGGNKMLLMNIEIHYPFTEAVRGFVFYDRGNVFGNGPDVLLTDDDYSLENMRHSYGFGVRVFTPIGPIGISYGIKLDKQSDEDAAELHFNIGRMF